MRGRAALLVLLAGCAGAEGSRATFLGAYAWQDGREGLGGLSAIELDADGAGFVALSDRAALVRGRLLRGEGGAVTGVEAERRPLLDRGGAPLRGPRADSEGLALGLDGALFISFEGSARVRREGARPELLPVHADWADLPRNASLEALAVDAEGRLLAIPESPVDGAFPVWRFEDGAWEVAFRFPPRDGFEVTGADVGPDGRLVVLERAFTGWAFRSRLRRFDLDGTGEEVLLTTPAGARDNLEGMAVWADAGGLRATLISDDNFRFFQRTEIVDYRLPP